MLHSEIQSLVWGAALTQLRTSWEMQNLSGGICHLSTQMAEAGGQVQDHTGPQNMLHANQGALPREALSQE